MIEESRVNPISSNSHEQEGQETAFTASNGTIIPYKKFNLGLLQRIVQQHQRSMPAKPTYLSARRNLATGEVIGHVEIPIEDELTARQVEEPGALALWHHYQEEVARIQAEQGEAFTHALMNLGTDFTPPDDGWAEAHEMVGLEVPQDPARRKTHWFLTEFPPQDLPALITGIMRYNGMDEEAVSEMETAFRGALRDREGQESPAGEVEDTGPDPAGTTGYRQPELGA